MSTKCYVLEQGTLPTLLRTGSYPGKPAHNTQKMSGVQYTYLKKAAFVSRGVSIADFTVLLTIFYFTDMRELEGSTKVCYQIYCE